MWFMWMNFSIEGVGGSSFTLDQFYTKKSYYAPLKAILDTDSRWSKLAPILPVQISSNNINCMDPVHFSMQTR